MRKSLLKADCLSKNGVIIDIKKNMSARKQSMKETFFWDFSSDAISTLSDLTSEGFEVDWTVRS